MKHFAYLDIEASHDNWNHLEIIEIAIVVKDQLGKDIDFFHSLVRPRNQINEKISKLTGITTNMLKNAPEFNNIAQKIIEKLAGRILVAHKAHFDFNLLSKELSYLNLSLNCKYICTLDLSQKLIPGLKSYSLKNLCNMMQIKLKSHHRALDDAQALYELHSYLRLINGELNEEKKFLPEHQKLISQTPRRPGVITIRSKYLNETHLCENLNSKLSELLSISKKNTKYFSSEIKIKTKLCSSLVEAGLLKSKIEKEIFPYCIYLVNVNNKNILRFGKTNIRKKALYYTYSRKEARNLIQKLTKTQVQPKLLFKDNNNKSSIVKENIELSNKIKDLVKLDKHYLIRSNETINDSFHYTIIKGNNSYACFKSEKIITNIDELRMMKLKFKNIGPREYMSLNFCLKWIKNQKTKTDSIIEIKQSEK